MDRARLEGRSAPRTLLLSFVLAAIGLVSAGPFLTSRAVGTGEAYNYSLSLADAVTQLRAGVVPPLVGQTAYAFNGRIHPLRNAPYMFYLAGAVDLASRHRLSFWELQNCILALSLFACAFACYLGLRWGAGCGRGAALGLAAAYAWCPALLAAAYAEDLYMTVLAAPFLPLALGACLRQARRPSVRNDLILAAALAAAWLAHPPVALWATAVTGVVRLVILVRQPAWRSLAGLAAAAVLFALLAGFGFVSAGTVTQGLAVLGAGGAFKQDYARMVVENSRLAFPGAFLPVSGRVPDLGNLQLGYAHWLLLAFAVAGLCRRPPRAAVGWDRRRLSVLALVAAAGFLVLLCLPVPGLTRALWLHFPVVVHVLTNIWPMQRLYLVATALIVFAAALTRPVLRSRWAAAPLVAAGLAWTLAQAAVFVAHGFAARWTPAQTAASHVTSNVDLSATSYAFFGLPDDYTSGVIDPVTRLRLVSYVDGIVTSDRSQPDLARAPVVQRGTFRRVAPGSDRLTPELTLAPGKRYLLELDFLTGPIRVYLHFSGEAMDRSYRLPDAGGPAGFGMAPTNSHTVVLWTDLDHPERVSAQIPSWGDGAPAGRRTDFARFTLREVDPAQLAVRLESFLPLRCTVDAPEDGLYLETFREFLPGYTARVDDRAAAVLRAPDGNVLVPVPRGRSEVEVRYTGSPLLVASFWLGAEGWAAFALWLSADLWAAGLLRLRPAAGWGGAWLARRRVPALCVVAALVAAVVVWPRGRPAELPFGPVRVRYLLPLDQTGKNQPIVVLGHDGNGAVIFLHLSDTGHVRVGADVWGRLFETAPLPVDYNRIQELVVSASALYPADDPRIRALGPAAAATLRGELRVDLDGANVLAVEHPPNAGETSDVHLGENPIGGSFAGPRFTGELRSSDRLALPQSLTLAPGEWVRLRLRLPPGPNRGREPLLTLSGDGRTASAYIFRESPRSARVGLFSFDGTWDERGGLPVGADGFVALEIRAGRRDGDAAPSALAIDGFGRPLLGPERLHPLLDPVRVVTARSLSSAAIRADFGGPELKAEVAADPALAGSRGAFDLVVSFPRNRPGRSEPLVVSGRPGAADLVYVVYADARHVRFGVDHWGGAGAMSGLVALDYGRNHEVEVGLGPLPADGVTVRLDGRIALATRIAAYPVAAGEISVGANRIGGSTCDANFSGEILFSGRRAPAPPAGVAQ